MHLIAVGQFGGWKVVPPLKLDQRDVPGCIDANNDRVVNHAIVQSAFHERTAGLDHVIVCDGKSVRRDQDARTAASSIRTEYGDRCSTGCHYGLNPLFLEFQECSIVIVRAGLLGCEGDDGD